MINCTRFRAQLDAYFDGEIDPVEKFRFEQHWDSCTTCKDAARVKFSEKLHERGFLEVYKRDTPLGDCMSLKTLEQYREGCLCSEEVALVERHLGQCTKCLERFDSPWVDATERKDQWRSSVAAVAIDWLHNASAVVLRNLATERLVPALALDDNDRPCETSKTIVLSDWLRTDDVHSESPWGSSILRITEIDEQQTPLDRFYIATIQGVVENTAGAVRVGLTTSEGGMLEAVLSPQAPIAILEGRKLSKSVRLDDLILWLTIERADKGH